MKRIIAFILPILLIFGCSKKTEFNTPSLLGKKDGDRWKATNFRAHIDDKGILKIEGTIDNERVVLVVPSSNAGTYELKKQIVSEALFYSADNTRFSTKSKPHPSVSLYPADGVVEIVEYNVVNKTVTGLFNFNAYSEDGLKKLNFSAGNFYRTPITDEPIRGGGGSDSEEDCEDAEELVLKAQKKFVDARDNFEPGSEEYKEACMAYKTTLINQKAACGDEDGSIQELIDNLGDCGKDDGGGDGNGNENPKNDFYAEVDGKEFVEEAIQGQVTSQAGQTGILLGGNIGQDIAIGIAVPTDIKKGTYTVQELGIYALAWTYLSGKDYANQAKAETIKLIVEEHDVVNKFIKATFEFDAKDKNDESKVYKIRKGAISVTYK